ncbi:MAG: hypothetical protein GVY19_12765 [Bacteroidetes bacterium]|jgi:hypothetical protein|nr:hypothetical protein [Bacteroidota bacterium]
MKTKLLVFAIITGLIFSACEKENENNGGNSGEPPKISIGSEEDLIEIPEGLENSSDPHATTCRTYIQLATNLSAFSYHFQPPSNAEEWNNKNAAAAVQDASDFSYTYSWTYGEQTITMYWLSNEENDRYTWDIDMEINGVRFEYLSAWEAKDNNEGEIQYNFNWTCAYTDEDEADCDNVYQIYKWNTLDDGTVTFDWLQEYESQEEGYTFKYNLTSNPDQSGELTFISDGENTQTYTWNPDGSGTFTNSEGETTNWDAAS